MISHGMLTALVLALLAPGILVCSAQDAPRKAVMASDSSFVLWMDREPGTLEQGGVASFTLYINDLSVNDTFGLEIGGSMYRQTFLDHSYIAIGTGECGSINVSIYASPSMKLGAQNITITVTRTSGPGRASVTLGLTAVRKGAGTTDVSDGREMITTLLVGLPMLAVILFLGAIVWFIRDHTRKGYEIRDMLIVSSSGKLILGNAGGDELKKIQLSALFTAIQMFAREAFGYGKGKLYPTDELGFKELKLGSITVLMEQRKGFYVAVIGTGEPDRKVRREVSRFADDFGRARLRR